MTAKKLRQMSVSERAEMQSVGAQMADSLGNPGDAQTLAAILEDNKETEANLCEIAESAVNPVAA
jgi:ferritin-like metal-binding protein YciE